MLRVFGCIFNPVISLSKQNYSNNKHAWMYNRLVIGKVLIPN